jgi:THUMP domain-like/RNA cap guanine-N2 methyltransferase
MVQSEMLSVLGSVATQDIASLQVSVLDYMLDLTTFAWLLTEEGRSITALAAAGDLTDGARLREISRLRRLVPPAQAAAAYETAILRSRARTKFPGADQLFFTREALEQASGTQIATYRAARYHKLGVPTIADLCCGIGGDTLALAAHAQVLAVDIDPLRLAIAQANAVALGMQAQITHIALDLETAAPPSSAAIFFDPARRVAGRRVFQSAEYQPRLALLGEWRGQYEAIGVKLAPGIAKEDLAWLGAMELEWISVHGELKEAVLWLGSPATPGIRATVLGRGNAVQSMFLPEGVAQTQVGLAEPQRYLIEPDGAVIRAGLVQKLAGQLGAQQIDREIAYLTSETLVPTPFARSWRILEWLPFSLKRLQARLRALDVRHVAVKKRGSPLETDALARRLAGHGTNDLTVVLTFVLGRPAALICQLIGSDSHE